MGLTESLEYFPFSVKELQRSINKKIIKKTTPAKYAGKRVLDIDEGNEYLTGLINSDAPCMVTRLGANELDLTIDALIKKKISPFHLHRMSIWSGFFPEKDEMAFKFGELMKECTAEIDLSALYYAHGEEYMLEKYAKNGVFCHNRAIEPWYTDKTPWTKYLKGKKVLIIHPFEDTIRDQYNKRELIFPDSDILPEFELLTLKAVQTVAGQKDERFSTWFDALDYMFEKSMNYNFDVAILGCGAYGLPLAAMLKKNGKKAIHLGGATQILFGIKGARWDNHPVISKLFNDSWIRPSDSDKPANAQSVENGCYW